MKFEKNQICILCIYKFFFIYILKNLKKIIYIIIYYIKKFLYIKMHIKFKKLYILKSYMHIFI